MVFKTPGVYIEEIAKLPPSVAQVETAIPAFIGYTDDAKLVVDDDLRGVPLRITSLLDYTTFFGGPPEQGGITVTVDADGVPTGAAIDAGTGPSDFRMYHALQMFFFNGGGPCYILSVGSYTDAIEKERLDSQGDPVADPPVVGGLQIIKKIDEVTLLLFPDANALGGTEYYDLYDEALAQCQDLQDRFTIIDLKREDAGITGTTTAIDLFRNEIRSEGEFTRYGAAYWPWLETTLNFDYDEDAVSFVDSAGAAFTDPDSGVFDAQVKEIIGKLFIEMPPGSAVAGLYAFVDRTRGVFKAPANVSVSAIVGPTIKINDADQEDLNVHTTGKSVNAIRAFTGKGTLVWGSRTLAGNDNEWRYIPVRRLFIMIEESVKKATQPFVFEPNDANTWVKIRAMIENFLLLQWRAGALAGAKPEDAFFVSVGLGETMTSLDILEGRLIVEIGLAAVRPAEFIILRFSHKVQVS